MNVLIYANKKSPRLIYTLDVIFKWIYRIDYQLTTDATFYRQNPAPKLNYSSTSLAEKEVQIIPVSLLFEYNIREISPQKGQIGDIPIFFATSRPDMPPSYDPLACIFFWLSRYEEYLPFKADAFGRFPASESLAFRQNLLDLPIVQIWANHMITQVQQYYPAFQPKPPRYQFQPTYDIDLAWAYRYKPFWRLSASLLKQLCLLQWEKAKYQLQVYRSQLPDPYDSYDFLETLHRQHQLSPLFFFLLASYKKNDINLPYDIPAMQQLIKRTTQTYRVGIHPSIQSNRKKRALKREINRLASTTNSKIFQSRQHFLMLRFPHTYEQLIQQDIIADYSLGFANQTGFRAGIALPYPWFNLQTNQVTPLLLYPFQVMDVTLKHYLQLSPEAAIEHTKHYIDIIKQYGGTFTTLWHNSSFAEHEGWKNWKPTYAKILNLALP